MDEQRFIDRIEDLKHTTATNIDDIQKCCCPMLASTYLNHQYEWRYFEEDNPLLHYVHNLWEENVQIYACNEIPYCYDNQRHNRQFVEKLDKLISEEVVWPVLFFVDGKAVPWSKITVIKTYDYSYIRIDDITDLYNSTATLLYFPIPVQLVRYGEDSDYLHDANVKGIYFDKDGYYVNDPFSVDDLSVRIEFLSDKIYFNKFNLAESDNTGYSSNTDFVWFNGLEKGFTPLPKNIIVFENGSIIGDGATAKLVNDPVNDNTPYWDTGAYGYYLRNSAYNSKDTTKTEVIEFYYTGHSKSSSYPYTKDINQNKVLYIAQNENSNADEEELVADDDIQKIIDGTYTSIGNDTDNTDTTNIINGVYTDNDDPLIDGTHTATDKFTLDNIIANAELDTVGKAIVRQTVFNKFDFDYDRVGYYEDKTVYTETNDSTAILYNYSDEDSVSDSTIKNIIDGSYTPDSSTDNASDIDKIINGTYTDSAENLNNGYTATDKQTLNDIINNINLGFDRYYTKAYKEATGTFKSTETYYMRIPGKTTDAGVKLVDQYIQDGNFKIGDEIPTSGVYYIFIGYTPVKYKHPKPGEHYYKLRTPSYRYNILQSMQYITRYDYSLWNKVFIDESPIKSFTYSGREFLAKADDKSYVSMSRRHTKYIEDVVMFFVNSKISEYQMDIQYTDATVRIPAYGIHDEDDIEIVMFTRCNNSVLQLRVAAADERVYINPEYNLEDCYIMDDQSDLAIYPTKDDELLRKEYICSIIDYDVNNDSEYAINFEDPSHYDRLLKIVPKNQFRYYRYKVSGVEPSDYDNAIYEQLASNTLVKRRYRIELPTSFNYCHDPDRYVIFVNGIKISKNEYTITIMNRYRPFDRLILYLATILDNNDRVDIFYVPEYLHEKYKEVRIGTDGTLTLWSNYPKLYALSKYTNMIFVNGMKINPRQLTDISMNRMIVNTKFNEVWNVCVVEYIDGSKEIGQFLYGLNGHEDVYGDKYPYNQDDLKQVVTQYLNELEKPIEGDSGQLIGNPVFVRDLDFSKYVYDAWTGMINRLTNRYMNQHEDEDGFDITSNTVKALYDFPEKLAIEDANDPYTDDYAPLRSVLYDIVLDYYVKRAGVLTGKPFTYDFEVAAFNEDNAENKDIDIFPQPARNEDGSVDQSIDTSNTLLDYKIDDKTAEEDDVVLDKAFLPANTN